jgi:CelD/BcsL family acetyltransferase involved in cellulose biosynthesis
MQATILSTLDEVRALEKEWSAIAPSSPYSDWDFAYDWLRSVPAARPHVVTVRVGGQLIAVAPWCLAQDRAGSLTLTGVGGEGAWYHDPVVRDSANSAAVYRTLGAALRPRSWDTIDLILQAKPGLSLTSELGRLGMAVTQRPSERQSRLLTLTGDWQSAWLRFPASFRQTVQRRTRRLDKISHRFHAADGELALEWLEELIRLNQLRWQTGKGWDSTYAVMRAHTPTLLARGQLRLFGLEIEGRLAALDYQIRKGDRSFMLMANYHPDFAEYSPGSLLMCWGLERLQGEGVRWADMGPGEYAWKLQIAAELVETVRIRVGSSLRGVALLGWRNMIKPRLLNATWGNRKHPLPVQVATASPRSSSSPPR